MHARKLAIKLRIPVVPGSDGAIKGAPSPALVKKIGFPMLLKAAAGGGGRGMRVVRSPGDLARAAREASSEALNAFGDGTLFIERYIERPKHVEVQVIGDRKGSAIHLFERECSVQRRHQKLIEEAPCPTLKPAVREKLTAAAVKLVRAARYDNAGTVEFLLDGKGNFYFLEVNSRLQVEHPVTEFITGLDLVRLQLIAAAGKKLPIRQRDIQIRGHAIECRILAEDPHGGFSPSLGEISAYRLPAGPFVRIDNDLFHGMPITIHYDSLIAKLIAWGATRDEAIDRTMRGLGEMKIIGVKTTIPFHKGMLRDRTFRTGKVHTKYVETQFKLREERGEAEMAAMLAASLEFLRRERVTPRTWSPRPLSSWKSAVRQEFKR